MPDSVESSSDQDVSSGDLHVRNYVKNMLRGSIFVGTYFERRYIEEINGYRDVVKVADSEDSLIKDLAAVHKRLTGSFGNRWIGITTPETVGVPVAHCLWVELEQEVFGSYWYKIKTVHFRHDEVIVKLKQVRPVDRVTSDVEQSEAELNVNAANRPPLNEVLLGKFQACAEDFVNALTFENFKNTVIFFSVLIAAVVTGSIELMKFFMEYSLKFMREVSIFFRTINPVLITVVHTVEKIVGGLFLLIAMLFRGSRSTGNVIYEVPPNAIGYSNQRAIQYRQDPYRKPMVIKELPD